MNKKIFASLVAPLAAVAAVTAVAAPAAAQPWGYDRPAYGYDRHDGWNINQRQERIDRRIDAGLRRGDLTAREADRLRREFWQIARLEQRYRVNGLNPWEREDLDRRFDRLEARLRFERHDDERRYSYYRY